MMDYSIVVPVYNEQEVLAETCRRLRQVMETTGGAFEIIFVDDGSRDGSVAILEEVARRDPAVKIVSLSRNFGQQAAISAGLAAASGKAMVIIDADLQDPPEVIPKMIEKWKEGFEVVYGRRAERKGETLFKRFTAAAFYRVLKSLTEHEIPVDTGDFRLIDRKVAEALGQLPEKSRYLRGLISWTGFKTAAVPYVREQRWAGVTKYPFRKMLRLSLDAITSFSYKPLKAASWAGGILAAAAFVGVVVALFRGLVGGAPVLSFGLLVGLILFSNGIILLALGVLGEYVARIYEEAKNRPLYLVARKINFGKSDASQSG
jgi:polyisoprenyl-phosphate glycosyltransferase